MEEGGEKENIEMDALPMVAHLASQTRRQTILHKGF